MKTKAFSLASGADVWMQAGPWSVIRFDEGNAGGSAPVIRVRSIDGSEVDAELKPGRQLRLNRAVQGVMITSLTGGAVSGEISLGDGDIVDAAVTGTVEVIDSSVNRTLAGQGFNLINFCASVASQYAHAQLFNPVGSGKRVRVDQVVVSVSQAGGVNAGLVSVPLSAAGLTPNGHSKLSGAPGSIAQGWRQNSATDLTAGSSLQAFVESVANTSQMIRFAYPVILLPGYGLTVRPSVLGASINAWYEFVEEAL